MKTWKITPWIWAVVTVAAIAAVAGLGILLATDGTNAFKNYADITCDKKRPERSLEAATKLMVTSALKGDKAGVCRTVGASSNPVNHWVNDEIMDSLREVISAHGITETHLRVVIPEDAQMGSHYTVLVYAGTGSSTEPLRLGATAHWSAGFTVNFPEGVRGLPEPEPEPNDPSGSASTEVSVSASAG